MIQLSHVRIYHAGDTIHYPGMEEELRPLNIDVALMPINGRDPEREAAGIVGNLDHEAAARIAANIGADVLIPMHYDMFAANPGYPDRLVEVVIRSYPGLTVVVPGKDRPFVYTGQSRQ